MPASLYYAYVYSGPIITLMGATRVVSVFHVFWNIGLAPSSYGQGTEAASVVAFLVIVMTTIPLPFSTFLAFYRRRKASTNLEAPSKFYPWF
ncbi:hypothetical protein Ae201684P_007614 [Aphanomyces euteiches]|nr:hypothetical protein Ae201684P_007614 [Aphanomyces euteiches]